MRAVLERYGIRSPSIPTARTGRCILRPRAARRIAGSPTQVGRALARLGIEHILGYSPQARGRSERANRTYRDRLVNELRVAGITTVAAANRYVHDRFLPAFNAEFGRRRLTPPPPLCPSGASISSRSSASKRNAPSGATMS